MNQDPHVVLVEDNPDDVDLIRHFFALHGIQARIHVLADGQSALDYFFGPKAAEARDAVALPRAVVLDLKLPKVDGLDVLQRLKSEPSTRNLPVIILTSSNQPRDVQQGYAAGANSYVVKPHEHDEFSSVMAAIGRYWLGINEPRP